MTDTVEVRVARGAAWLDDKYPAWYRVIDLSVLEMADCHQCVLGQVYTGCIPTAERGQLIAQLAARRAASYGYDVIREQGYIATHWGGYTALAEFHELDDSGRSHGFLGMSDDNGDDRNDYQALLDEWTRVIIQRRLDDHPDVVEFSKIREIPGELVAA